MKCMHQEIHKFAIKWYNLFSDRNTTGSQLIDDTSFMDECFKFGFEMDSGESFKARYPKAFSDKPEELKKIIGEIYDVHFLGSAIFSMWRYYNHWAYSLAEGTSEEAREWFMTALGRLKELIEEYPPSFFEWYDKNKDKLEKLYLGDMEKFLEEHPEKKMAYWFKLFDSGMTDEELNEMIRRKAKNDYRTVKESD